MNKNLFFPNGYKSKIDFQNTLKFISVFNLELFKELLNKNGFYCSDNLFSNLTIHPNLYSNIYRDISFDNFNYDDIFSINNSQNYFIKKYLSNKENLKFDLAFTFSKMINRDAELSFKNSISRDVIYIETRYKNAQKIENITNNILQVINTAANNALKAIKDKKIVNFQINKIDDIRRLIDKKSFLPKKNIIHSFIKENQFILLKNCSDKFIDQYDEITEPIKKNDKDTERYAYYVYDNVSEDILRILLIDFNFYENTNVEKTFSIIIETSNIIKFVLEKFHIAEVTSSAWTEEFYNFCEKNKINIL